MGDFGVDDDPANPTHELTIANLILATNGPRRVSNHSVADVDKPLLSVAQVVHNGGKVVFSQVGSYIEHASGRQDQLEFRNGLYVLRLWVPRDQGMDFHGQA